MFLFCVLGAYDMYKKKKYCRVNLTYNTTNQNQKSTDLVCETCNLVSFLFYKVLARLFWNLLNRDIVKYIA